MPVSLQEVFEDLRVSIEGRLQSGHESIEAVKERLCGALKNKLDDIWDYGLEMRSFDILVGVFINAQVDKTFVCLILDCLVPTDIISDETAGEMILFVIKNCIKFQPECAEVLRWLATIIRFGVINPKIVDQSYNELLKRLLFPPLVKSLSEILVQAAKPVFMTKSNVKLLEKICEDQFGDVRIKSILREFAKHVPHLVNQKYHFVQPQGGRQTSDFDKVVQRIVTEKVELRAALPVSTPHVHCSDLPSLEYGEMRKDAYVKQIGDVKSAIELGRNLIRLQLPKNELALLRTEEGILFVTAKGPSLNFLTTLDSALQSDPTKELIASISGLQDILSYGLPPVTPFLSNFLICWDGAHNEDYLYSLLPRLYFRDFKDLKDNILGPLFRVFVTESPETKVKILDSLLLLITHMVAVDMKRGNAPYCDTIPSPEWINESDSTVASVIEYVICMWKQALILDGPQCTFLVLKSILFYQKMNHLILDCGLRLFFVINHNLSCSALMSKNHVVLSELCLLILQYKKNLIPHFEQEGLLGECELEVESVSALADSTFKYLWERVGGERPGNFHVTQDEFTPSASVGVEHLGLYPFLYEVAAELHRTPEDLTKNELMSILEAFMPNVAEFIKYEELEQLRHNPTSTISV